LFENITEAYKRARVDEPLAPKIYVRFAEELEKMNFRSLSPDTTWPGVLVDYVLTDDINRIRRPAAKLFEVPKANYEVS